MTTGRPPTPIEVKRRRGTLRPSRTPTPVGGTLALAPAILSPGEVTDALLAAGAGAWLSQVDSVLLLPLIERAWAEMRVLDARWVASDYSNDSIARRLKAVEENLTKWLSLAGLPPTERARLGLTEVKARSKFEEMEARRAARPGPPAG